jgi:nucleoside-diphosphate-sugar epimerase
VLQIKKLIEGCPPFMMFQAHKIIGLCSKKGKIKPVHVAPRPGEVRRLVADYSKAKKLLGWQPECMFERGLLEFIKWYKSYKFEEWAKPG